MRVDRGEFRSIVDLFQDQVRRHAEAVALVCDEEQMTYGELNSAANRIARCLHDLGSAENSLVALYIERSPEMFACILGVLKAQCCYLPIDTTYPMQRVDYILRDSGVSYLIAATAPPCDFSVPEGIRVIRLDELSGYLRCLPDIDLDLPISPQSLAYVIYTSGSTGVPKGVMVTHAGLANLAPQVIDTFNVDVGARILQFASASYDAAVWEWVMALAGGGTLCIVRQYGTLLAAMLNIVIAKYHITHITLPPSVLRLVNPDLCPSLAFVIAAGEACPPDLVQSWAKRCCFTNAYGPTEATICASMAVELTGAEPPHIGRALNNIEIRILDQNLKTAADEVVGEIHIGGIALAKGYINKPELTRQKFIADPLDPHNVSYLYRTGDLGKRLADGNIVFIGRIDHQVKINGTRVELAEIEAAIRTLPHIREAAVLACGTDQQPVLAAFVVPATPASAAAGAVPGDALRGQLAKLLPPAMIPMLVREIDQIPLTVNGKIDRKALLALLQ